MGCRSCQPGAFQSCFAASLGSSGPSESSTWPIRPGSLPRLPRASGSDEQHRCGSHPVGRRSLNCGRSSRYLDRRAGWRGDQQSRSEAALDADNPGRGMSRRLARVHPSIRGPVAGELPTHASTGGETAVGLGTVESSPSGAQSGCRSPHRGSCPPDRRRLLGVAPAHRTGRPEGSRLIPARNRMEAARLDFVNTARQLLARPGPELPRLSGRPDPSDPVWRESTADQPTKAFIGYWTGVVSRD